MLNGQYDDLKCKNCGYDGGVAHQKEVSELKQKVTSLKRPEETTTRIVIISSVLLLISIVVGVTINSIEMESNKKEIQMKKIEQCSNEK